MCIPDLIKFWREPIVPDKFTGQARYSFAVKIKKQNWRIM
jgi:hypothetical protein